MRPMATAGITWQKLQQAPEDGRRREAVGGDLYVTAAPSIRHQRVSKRLDGDAVEVWRFGGDAERGTSAPASAAGDGSTGSPGTGSGRAHEPVHERFTERLPVRVGGDVVGEIDLGEVFARGG